MGDPKVLYSSLSKAFQTCCHTVSDCLGLARTDVIPYVMLNGGKYPLCENLEIRISFYADGSHWMRYRRYINVYTGPVVTLFVTGLADDPAAIGRRVAWVILKDPEAVAEIEKCLEKIHRKPPHEICGESM